MSLKERCKKFIDAVKTSVPTQSRFVAPVAPTGRIPAPGWRNSRWLGILHELRSELAADLKWVQNRHASFVDNARRGNTNNPIVIQARDGRYVTIPPEVAEEIIRSLKEQLAALDIVLDGLMHGSGLQRAVYLADAKALIAAQHPELPLTA